LPDTCSEAEIASGRVLDACSEAAGVPPTHSHLVVRCWSAAVASVSCLRARIRARFGAMPPTGMLRRAPTAC